MAHGLRAARADWGERASTLLFSDRFRETASVAFVLALATTMLFPVFRGDWPIGHDHPVHLFRIWQLRETLLHHGMPWTWSHRWFAGYPQNVVYAVGADFFVLGIQAISFGLLSLGRAYGIAFWAFYCLYGYATFFFVSRAVRSRVAGLIAVVFLLTDPGSNDVGGWFWVVDVGVWTSAFGMVPALLGTVWMASLLEKPRPRTAAVVGLCFGLALLLHQIQLIYFGMAIPLLCLSRYLSGEETDWRRALALLGAGLGAGLLLASFWLVPYFAALPYAAEVGGSGNDITHIADAIAANNFFPRMHPLAVAFGLVGALCLWRSRRPLPLFMALFIFVTVVGSSSSFAALFGSSVALWVRNHIIAERLLLLVKPFWYGAAGFLLVSSWHAVEVLLNRRDENAPVDALSGRPGWARRVVLVALFCFFVAPVLGRVVSIFYHNEVRRPTIWHSERRDLKARRQFVTWLQKEIPAGQFFRIAHGFDYDDHDLTDLGMEIPYPLYKIWHMPTGHFKYDIGWNTNAALRASNVRFALLKHALTGRSDFTLLKIFDQQLWLYRFNDWRPEPFEIEGGGNVQLLDLEEEDIVLRAGEGAHGQLRLNISYFPKWTATRDHLPMTIKPVGLPGIPNSGFMQTELAPGLYHFHFRRSWTDYMGSLLGLLGMGAVVLLAREGKLRWGKSGREKSA